MMKSQAGGFAFAAGEDAVRSYTILPLSLPAQQRSSRNGFSEMTTLVAGQELKAVTNKMGTRDLESGDY